MRKLLQKALVRNQSKLFLRVNVLLTLVTILSILAISLETVHELSSYSHVYLAIEYIAVVVFTVEFLARLYAKEDRKEYLLSLYGWIDLLSILPTFLGLFNFTFIKAARIVRLLRFLRLSRLAKLSRMSKFSNHNSRKAKEIQLISIRIYGLVLLSTTVVFSGLLYVVEASDPLFQDIPSAFLWVIVTILGGNVDPHSFSILARILVVGLQFSSMLLFGLLVAIFGRSLERRLLGSASLED